MKNDGASSRVVERAGASEQSDHRSPRAGGSYRARTGRLAGAAAVHGRVQARDPAGSWEYADG